LKVNEEERNREDIQKIGFTRQTKESGKCIYASLTPDDLRKEPK
jgi:hypothetical protein